MIDVLLIKEFFMNKTVTIKTINWVLMYQKFDILMLQYPAS